MKLDVNRPLISALQAKEAIDSSESSPVILDCSWFMPNVPRNARKEYLELRVPGARFFDLDEVVDKTSMYPHMLPSSEDFTTAVRIYTITRIPMTDTCRQTWNCSGSIKI